MLKENNEKFRRDVSWSLISFIIIGISGIIINVLIGRFYGATYLGAFNIVFAIYILLSQVAVFGVHLSVLKYVSQYAATKPDKLPVIIYSSIYLTATISLFITVISVLLSNILGKLFSSQLVSVLWIYISIGLFFFAMNKTLLSVFNGLREMKFFAISQALRYFLALLIVVVFIFSDISGDKLGLVLSLSEMVLFIMLLYNLFMKVKIVPLLSSMSWVKRHYKFGKASVVGGMMSEINTRVDILVLGIFVSDKLVGIYTVALMIFEGYVQLAVVLRNNYNPIISRFIGEGKHSNLSIIIKNGRNKFYLFMFVLVTVSFFVYPTFVYMLIGTEFVDSVPIYYILMIGVILSAGYLPFDMLLSQSGFPDSQSFYKSVSVLTNVVLNFLLINLYGLIGAALATALTYVGSVFLLKYLVKKEVKIDI